MMRRGGGAKLARLGAHYVKGGVAKRERIHFPLAVGASAASKKNGKWGGGGWASRLRGKNGPTCLDEKSKKNQKIKFRRHMASVWT